MKNLLGMASQGVAFPKEEYEADDVMVDDKFAKVIRF